MSEEIASSELYGASYAEAQAHSRADGMPPFYLKQTANAIDQLIKRFPDNNRFFVLEEGSGAGDLARAMEGEFLQKNISAVIIPSDINVHALKISQQRREAGKLGNETVCDVINKPIATASVDAVVKAHVDEHLTWEQIVKSYEETARVLRDGGLCLSYFPKPWISRFEGALFEAFDLEKNPIKAVPLAARLHPTRINPEILQSTLNRYDIPLKQIRHESMFVPQELGFCWMTLMERVPRTQASSV